jgi:hypothetical protein
MKLSLLLLPVLALPAAAASRGASPFTFELPGLQAQVRRLGPASVGELLDEFAKADRVRQREILEELPMRTGGSSWEDQARLVWTLRDAARSAQTPSEVRAKALHALGKCARQMSLSSAGKDAVTVLIEEAKKEGPFDDTGLQPHALMGIAEAAGALPYTDQAGREDLVEALLDIRKRRNSSLEVTLALKGLAAHFGAYGASYVWNKLGERIDNELVRAGENGSLNGAYSESTLTTEGRYFWVRALWSLAWIQHPSEYGMRDRCRGVLYDISRLETDANLRAIARLYAERLNG